MAKHTVIQMTDDLDGSEATQSIEFSFRGKSYTIDLNDANASDFDDALAPYIAAAEKSGGAQPSRGGARRASTPRQRASGDVDPKQVRAWAEANGVAVSPVAVSRPTSWSSTGPPTPDRSKRHRPRRP